LTAQWTVQQEQLGSGEYRDAYLEIARNNPGRHFEREWIDWFRGPGQTLKQSQTPCNREKEISFFRRIMKSTVIIRTSRYLYSRTLVLPPVGVPGSVFHPIGCCSSHHWKYDERSYRVDIGFWAGFFFKTSANMPNISSAEIPSFRLSASF
jgi:hypothetical protein